MMGVEPFEVTPDALDDSWFRRNLHSRAGRAILDISPGGLVMEPRERRHSLVGERSSEFGSGELGSSLVSNPGECVRRVWSKSF
ncbi:MAG: hypothetical protein J07HX5_01542 [halophilic archaeon J07HX5]|nr:MAG: hypothetical protein J07HX5_01542 [halophilic archaeon J07HX5]